MRLRDVSYPIAVLQNDGLYGGGGGGLSSPRRWDYNIADYYLKGAFDDAIIYDSTGKKFEVERILLYPSHWLDNLGDRADHFFLGKSNPDPANVDMELRQVGELTVETFVREITEIILANPSWWNGKFSEQEMRDLLRECSTVAEAIDKIGVLDRTGGEKLKGRSRKAVDLRR